MPRRAQSQAVKVALDTIDDEGPEPTKLERLFAFVQGLRDDMKISEAEYQIARQILD